jgi:hypothetical protein
LIDNLETPNLHWFYSLATISIVELVLREEDPISFPLVKCIIEKGLLSEIPGKLFVGLTLFSPPHYDTLLLFSNSSYIYYNSTTDFFLYQEKKRSVRFIKQATVED